MEKFIIYLGNLAYYFNFELSIDFEKERFAKVSNLFKKDLYPRGYPITPFQKRILIAFLIFRLYCKKVVLNEERVNLIYESIPLIYHFIGLDTVDLNKKLTRDENGLVLTYLSLEEFTDQNKLKEIKSFYFEKMKSPRYIVKYQHRTKSLRNSCLSGEEIAHYKNYLGPNFKSELIKFCDSLK